MWVQTGCDSEFDITVPTPFFLMLRRRSGAQQWVAREECRLVPGVPVFKFTDDYGNLSQRLIAPPGDFAVHTTVEVMTADDVDQAPGAPFIDVQFLPDSVLKYLLPSRYSESDRFGQMATEITVGRRIGYDQAATSPCQRWRSITDNRGSVGIFLTLASLNVAV